MRGFNHIAGGLAFTGIFASFADVNIFARPEYLVTCVFFSLLADVDHTRSILGKLFYPMAKWLDRHYGHRTITHSLPCYLGVVVGVGVAERLVTGRATLTGIVALSYGSHLLFDMCTRSGIPFFLPFTRARCVLPGNPNLRLSNTQPLAEVVVFFGFCLLILTTMPLMSAGFWVTVNNEFATFNHVLREYQRRPDVLWLRTEEGVAGQVVAATENGAVLWDGKQFRTLREGQDHPEEFRHTNQPRPAQRLEFAAISADSLRHLLALPTLNLQATGTLPIRYRVDGQQYEQPTIKLDYPAPGFAFQEVRPDNSATVAQLLRLQTTLAGYAAANHKYQVEQATKSARVQALQKAYPTASGYEQGKSTEEIARLSAELAAATPPDNLGEIGLARAEIKRLKLSLSNQTLTFTGVITTWNP